MQSVSKGHKLAHVTISVMMISILLEPHFYMLNN